jgi:hypothetical protein
MPGASPPTPYHATGVIDADGGVLLSQGFGPFASDAMIVLAGNFFKGRGAEVAGEWIASFCPQLPCNGVIRNRSGEFAASQ